MLSNYYLLNMYESAASLQAVKAGCSSLLNELTAYTDYPYN